MFLRFALRPSPTQPPTDPWSGNEHVFFDDRLAHFILGAGPVSFSGKFSFNINGNCAPLSGHVGAGARAYLLRRKRRCSQARCSRRNRCSCRCLIFAALEWSADSACVVQASFRWSHHASSRRSLSCDYFVANIRIEVALDSAKSETWKPEKPLEPAEIAFCVDFDDSNYLFNYTH